VADIASTDEILGLLRGVVDPELGSDIVELGMAKSVIISPAGEVEIMIDLTIEGCPLQGQIRKDVVARVESAPGVTSVKIQWGVLSQEEKSATMAVARKNAAARSAVTAISPTTKVITVASGKGGVGKSSITVNLAVGLAERGFTVGVIDADIGGFSLPRMFGISGRLTGTTEPSSSTDTGANSEGAGTTSDNSTTDDDAGHEVADTSDSDSEKSATTKTSAPLGQGPRMVPLEQRYGDGLVRLVSMGFLTDTEETALPWRGATLGRAVQHFLEDVRWGELDYLLVDTPPGTGDIQMGLARMLPRAEVIVVTTPALTAQKVASRAVDLARKHFLRVVGVVENMSAFVCDHGESYPLFGEGGGLALAEGAGVPLLASIPLDGAVASDTGTPPIQGSGPGAAALNQLVDHIASEAIPPTDLASCSARILGGVDSLEPVEVGVEVRKVSR